MTKPTKNNRPTASKSNKKIRVLAPKQLAAVKGGSNKLFVGGL